MTITVGTNLQPTIAGLESISSGQIAVREVKVEDPRPHAESLVVVYLTPPDSKNLWDLDDFAAVRARARDLVSTSPLGDMALISSSGGDPSARIQPPQRGTKVLAGRSRRRHALESV